MRLIDIGPCETHGHACLMYATEDGGLVQAFTSELPTIDAVPVVRCKDCRWSRTNQKDDADVYYCELRTGRAYHSGDYCSYGKRKDGEC